MYLQRIFVYPPVNNDTGPLPALGVDFERVLDVVVRVAVVPHHVRLQLVLQHQFEMLSQYLIVLECINGPCSPQGGGPSRKSSFFSTNNINSENFSFLFCSNPTNDINIKKAFKLMNRTTTSTKFDESQHDESAV